MAGFCGLFLLLLQILKYQQKTDQINDKKQHLLSPPPPPPPTPHPISHPCPGADIPLSAPSVSTSRPLSAITHITQRAAMVCQMYTRHWSQSSYSIYLLGTKRAYSMGRRNKNKIFRQRGYTKISSMSKTV